MKKRFYSTSFLLLILCCGIKAPPTVSAENRAQSIQIVGHRGNSAHAPENTIPAFREAFVNGADAVEFDMQVTKDRKIIIMHDLTLNRTTNGKGAVKEKNELDIRKLDAGQWFSPKYKGAKVPTLSEVLSVAKAFHKPVFAEIKGYRKRSDVAEMVKTIVSQGYENKAVLTSFHYGDFIVARKYTKTETFGYLTADEISFRRALQLIKRDHNNGQIHANYKLLLRLPNLVAEASFQHIPVYAWTVNDQNTRDKLIDIGVSGILTNDPGKLKKLTDFSNDSAFMMKATMF